MTKRQRLSSEEARRRILEAAQKCLIEQGIDGLRIANVAAEAKIVHSSILHHFGSADGLKQALGKQLSIQMFDEIASALSSADTEHMALEALHKLFDAFGPGGHANLIAWLVIAGPDHEHHLNRVQEEYAQLFANIVMLVQENLTRIRAQEVTADEARFVVFHVLIAACGFGIIGESVAATLGISDKQPEFLRWFADHIQRPRQATDK